MAAGGLLGSGGGALQAGYASLDASTNHLFSPSHPISGNESLMISDGETRFVMAKPILCQTLNGTGGLGGSGTIGGSGGANGGGGDDDDYDSSDMDKLLLDLKRGQNLLAKGSGQVAAAKRMLDPAFSAIREHIEKLESQVTELSSEKEALEAELEEKKQNSVPRKDYDAKAAELVAINRRIHGFEGQIRELKATLESERKETAPLRQKAKAAQANEAELEAMRVSSSLAKDAMLRLEDLFQGAEGSTDSALSAMLAAHEAIAPILGNDSPVAAKIKEAIDLIEAAKDTFDLMSGMASEVERYLEPASATKGKPTDASDPVSAAEEDKAVRQPGAAFSLDRSKFPELSDDAAAGIPGVSNEAMTSALSRLKTAFEDIDSVKTSEIYDAFVHSMRTLYDNNQIHGAWRAANRAMATMLHPDSQLTDIRGFFFEIVRLAQLIEGGRGIDSIAIIVPSIFYVGFRLDYASDELRLVELSKSSAEVDASAGKTLIEIKTMSLGNSVGGYIKLLLAAAKENRVPNIDVRAIRKHNGHAFASFRKALNIANQLIKYSYILDGTSSRVLEYHNTAYNPAPSDVITAMHEFFGEGKFRYIWYHDILDPSGHEIIPNDVLAAERRNGRQPEVIYKGRIEPEAGGAEQAQAEAQPEEPARDIEATTSPDSADDEVEIGEDSGEDSVEVIIEVDESISEDEAEDDHEIEATVEPSSAGTAAEPVAHSAVSASDEEEAELEAELQLLENSVSAKQTIYSNNVFLQSLGYNTSGVDNFITWLVEAGHWHPEFQQMGEYTLSEILRNHYRTWQAEQQNAAEEEAEANAPWQVVDDNAAQRAFNAFLKHTAPVKLCMDWSYYVARDVSNKNISLALAIIQDTDVVKASEELHERIGAFIAHIRELRAPGNWFKISEDGPELLVIMKQYLWLTDGGPSNGS